MSVVGEQIATQSRNNQNLSVTGAFGSIKGYGRARPSSPPAEAGPNGPTRYGRTDYTRGRWQQVRPADWAPEIDEFIILPANLPCQGYVGEQRTGV